MVDRILKRTLDFLSSYAFAVILLLFLLLLTLLGTLEQVDVGLFEAQKKYFESIFLVHWFGPVPVLLPGVYLVLVLLTVNLVLGGVLRMKRSWTRVGIYITHFGILLLIFTSFRSYRESVHGSLTLFEGERSSEFVSNYDWEVAIWRVDAPAPATEYKIPNEELIDLTDGRSRAFRSKEIPFELTVWNWVPNSRPVPVAPGRGAASTSMGGVLLQPLGPMKAAERNQAGAYATVKWKDSDWTERGVLWGGLRQRHPYLVESDEGKWAIDLRKTRMNLPFRLRLDDFYHETYPGTGKPKVFRSVVTTTDEDGTEQTVRIEMNEPLRSGQMTIYQSNWGPQDGPPDRELFSGFSVVRNPVDQWPLYCTIVIGVGLLVHFGRKLWIYLERETRRRRA